MSLRHTRRLVPALAATLATMLTGAALTASSAEARQLGWGQHYIAASGCDTFKTPTYDWVSMHTRLSQYICWRNGRITQAGQPQESCWVDWHGRAAQLECHSSRAYTQTYNYGISQYSRGTFDFRQSVAGWQTWGGWRPAVSLRLRARDRIVTSYAWTQ